MPIADRPTLVRACKLYYLEEKSQEDIARELRVSRPSVSRLLDQARREKVVEFRIRDEVGRAAWSELGARLGLIDLVVATGSGTAAVGAVAAEHFLGRVRRGDVVGLTAGRTLSAFVESVRPGRSLELEIVPLVGALWETGQEYDGSFLCQELRRRVGGTHWVLSVPAVLGQARLAQQLRGEPRVQGVLERYRSLRCAIVGIGSAGREHPLLQAAATGGSRRGRAATVPRQAFVSVGSLFFTREGRPCPTPLDHRVLGITHAELAAVPSRLGLAAGAEKAALVHALLRGGVLTGLVVDEPLAHELQRLAPAAHSPQPYRETSP